MEHAAFTERRSGMKMRPSRGTDARRGNKTYYETIDYCRSRVATFCHLCRGTIPSSFCGRLSVCAGALTSMESDSQFRSQSGESNHRQTPACDRQKSEIPSFSPNQSAGDSLFTTIPTADLVRTDGKEIFHVLEDFVSVYHAADARSDVLSQRGGVTERQNGRLCAGSANMHIKCRGGRRKRCSRRWRRHEGEGRRLAGVPLPCDPTLACDDVLPSVLGGAATRNGESGR